jgi:gamma-glutamylcyclotransferase (GGCT)/AIG2-like uncharacterized protein YtfP
MARDRMSREAPLDARALADIEASDIVVVRGSYDHVELVLDALELPHTAVRPGQLRQVELRPEQLLVVNCPGQLPAAEVVQVREFVDAGGSLFSTDWALRHLIEAAFPNLLAYNDRPTADAVVRIEIHDRDHPFLRGVLDEGDDPQWWLEGSSYPIRVLDPDRVKVLLTSRELESRWGEAPVAVWFEHGRGEVFHMISHYYLQRTELRTARHRAPAAAYWEEKDLAMSGLVAEYSEDLSLGEVEAGYSSQRLFSNVAAAKKRRARRARWEGLPNRFFAYGTFRPGHERWGAIERFVRTHRPARVPGRLYDTGAGFPAARFDEDGHVEGVLCELAPAAVAEAAEIIVDLSNGLFELRRVVTEDGTSAFSTHWSADMTGLTVLSGPWAGN